MKPVLLCTNAKTCKRTPKKACHHEQPHVEAHDCIITCIDHGRCKPVNLTIVRDEKELP